MTVSTRSSRTKRLFFLEALLEPSVLEPLQSLLQSGQRCQSVLDYLNLPLDVGDPTAKTLQLQPKLRLSSDEPRVLFDEALEQQGQLLPALGQL